MCGIAAVGAVASIASTAFGAYTSIQQSRAAAKSAEATADYNARVAENEATEARNVATEKENIHRQKVQQLLSKQRAQIGASGIELGSGSALQLQEDTITQGEVDALRIRSQGDRQFTGLQQESELISAQGEAKADALRTQGLVSAGGTLLSGTSQFLGTGVADKWFTSDSAASTVPISQGAGFITPTALR